ncbi:serine/threonine protein kinase [Clostridium saudiense]|nr:serine/threonine protein kinase [Clostridium saudiense]
MENVSFDEIESKYSELAQLNNSKKSDVYLVQDVLDRRIYIKKELKNYNIEVYKQIKNIQSIYMARVYEIFKCDDTLVVIEEFINGRTLQQIIDNEGPLNEDVAIKYIMDLCSILDILHNQNPPIIHRDIKPSNIIIDNNGILKLIDFDVSRVYRDEKNRDTHILGTKGYASPEQFGFEQTDCRSDIYSVGVLINVLTTGKYMKEQLNDGRLRHIIEKCTNISPDNRYKSVKELQIALNDILNINSEEISRTEDKKINSSKKELDGLEKKQKNDNKLLSIIESIPGFRAKNPKKMVLAVLWYMFLIFGLTSNWSSGNLGLILEDLNLVILLLGFTLFNCNFNGIKNKLPIVRKKDRESKTAGILIYNILIFVIFGVLLELIEALF